MCGFVFTKHKFLYLNSASRSHCYQCRRSSVHKHIARTVVARYARALYLALEAWKALCFVWSFDAPVCSLGQEPFSWALDA